MAKWLIPREDERPVALNLCVSLCFLFVRPGFTPHAPYRLLTDMLLICTMTTVHLCLFYCMSSNENTNIHLIFKVNELSTGATKRRLRELQHLNLSVCACDPCCWVSSACCLYIYFFVFLWTFSILLCYLLSVSFLSLFFLFVFFVKCALSSAAASPPRPPPPSSSGRGGSRGAGGVPPRRQLRRGALHPTAAIPSPAYRGASKPLPSPPPGCKVH